MSQSGAELFKEFMDALVAQGDKGTVQVTQQDHIDHINETFRSMARKATFQAKAAEDKQKAITPEVRAKIAQQEYDNYVKSEEYTNNRMKAIRLRLLEVAATPGASVSDAPMSSFNVTDRKEQELRAKRDYFIAEAQKQKDQAVTDANLEELSSWPEEDRQQLILYASNRNRDALRPIELAGAYGIQTAQQEAAPLIQKYGIEKVNALAESYMRMQNQEATEKVKAKADQWADSGIPGGIAHSAASVGANLIGSLTSPLGYLVEAGQRTGQYSTMDANNAGGIPNVYADAVRGRVAENLTGDVYDENGQLVQNGGLGRAALATVYQAGMSALDNLARMAVSGGSSAVSLGLAATGAFGRSMSQYSSQGASPIEAVAMSTVDAGLEVLTEKISLDNILKQATSSPANFLDWMKNLSISGLVEVSEEEMSFLGSSILESIVLREKSSYNQQIAQAVAEGKTYEQAKVAADIGLIKEAAQTFIQSYLSGGMMSGAAQARGSAQAASLGRNISKRGMGQQETSELIQKGLESDPESAVNQVAQQLQKKQDKGKALTSYDQGRMFQAAAQSGDNSFGAIMQKQIMENNRRRLGLPVEDSAQAVNQADTNGQVQQSLDRMSKATGRSYQLYEQDATSAGMENGYYENGVIHINTKGKDPHVQVFSHELTHSVEMAESYQELSNLIFDRIKASGVDLEQMRKDKQDLYAANGYKLDTKGVDSEIIADYVADHLLTDEQSILQLARENRTLAERIKGWFDKLLARLGNENAQERIFLQNARDLYAKALKQAPQMQPKHADMESEQTMQDGNDSTDSDDGLEDMRRWAEEAYRSGQMSQEEYDSMMDYIEQQAELDNIPQERKYSYAGPKAATADLEALRQAKEMAEQDVAAETIRQQTGWFQGMDGKWRFEIDDSDMRYHRGGDARFSEMHEDYARYQELTQKMLYWNLTQEEESELRELDEIWGREYGRLNDLVNRGNAQLQNILRHDALFEAYPQLRGANVKFADLEDGTNGSYNQRTNTITLSNKLRNAPQKTLLHEIQHIIQDIEGFSPGASMEYWKEQRADIVETIAAARKNLDLWLNDIGYTEVRDASLKKVVKREKTLEQHWRDMADFKANSQYAKQIANCEAEIAEFQRQYDEITHGMTVYDQYHNTAGEIEARDTANRRDLDAEGRKNTPPDLGDEDTVFADGSEKSYSISQIDGEQGSYGQGVVLDTNIFDGVRTSGWGKVLGHFVYQNLAGKELTVYNESGEAENIYLARENDRVRKDGAKNSHKVIDKLARYRGDNIAALATVHISELLETSHLDSVTDEHNHQWLDENGWIIRKTYIQDNKGNIYEAMLNIADGRDRKILYAINNVRQIDKRAAHGDVPSTSNGRGSHIKSNSSRDSLAETGEDVKRQFSISPAAETQDQQNQAEKEEKPDVRATLPAKARSYLEGKERELLNNLAYNLYVPRFAKRNYLAPILKELSDDYLQDGTINQDRADFLFEMAFANGIIADSEFYDQYKDLKKHIRTTTLTISDRDKADIADFQDFQKRSRGTLTIVNSGGLPIDTAYGELHTMAPELFPESITHPADQLQHIYDVAKGIQVSEKNLIDYFKDSADEFKKDARNRFQESIRQIEREMKRVQKYAEEAAGKKAEKESAPTTPQEAAAAYQKMKDARRKTERAEAKNLLLEKDKQELGRLLQGKIRPEHLNPDEVNVDGILAVYEAKREYETYAKQIAEYKRNIRGELRKKADTFLETAMTWKDKKSGIQYSRETMRRNIQDIVPDKDLAKEINDTYFEPVHVSEAEATRFKNEFRDKVRSMNLATKPRKGDLVSEAHAVQLYGEAMENIEMIRNSRGRMKTRDGKTAQEWQAVIQDMFDQSPSLDRSKVEKAVNGFRDIYNDLYQRMNDVRIANGYEPVNYRRGYFPHFQMENGDSMLLQFGRALGIDTQMNPLPTTINGLTSTFRPGIQWFGHAQNRIGFNTAYDAVQGFDQYIEGVANVIYHTENIQKLRALEAQIRYRTSDEGIRKQVDAVNADTRLTEDEKEMKISEIYKNGKYVLSNFVNELSEYTNLLAGKKSRLDRGMEALIGRRAYTIVKNLENRVGANMIAGNLNSALTNFIPLTQASAQLDRNMIAKGMWDTLRSYKQEDGLSAMSTFLTNRRGSESLVRTRVDAISQTLGKPMELIDNFVSESIVRAAFHQYQKTGLSDTEAMYQADIFASGVMADRSKGSMPTLFESKNPLIKAFTQFQLEVNNQFSEVFKDIPRREKEAGLKALTGTLLKYFLGAFLYNEVYEWMFGRRPAMDPIGILNDTVGSWIGYELRGEENDGPGDAIAEMGNQVVQQLPFVSGIAGGGRIPISSAIPDVGNLWDAATEEEWSPEKRWAEVKSELNKLAYVIPPFAGGQISKSWKGIKAFIEGGSYTVDAEGNDILQYPIFREEDGFSTFMKAAVFGKNSLPIAQEWVKDGFDSLSAKQTAVYQDLLAEGTGERKAYDIIRELGSVVKTEERSVAEQEREIVMSSDLSSEAKAILYYSTLGKDDTDRILMDTLADQGADSGEVAMVLMKIKDAEKLEGAEQSCAKRDAIAAAVLTDEEKHQIYREKVSDSREDEISQILASGLDFDAFLEIQNSYTRINEKYSKATDKAQAFSHWLNKQGYTDRQVTAAKESFKYFSMYPAVAKKYDGFVAAGIDAEKSYTMATNISELKPLPGKDKVDDLQEFRVVVDSGLSQREQMKALEVVITKGFYKRINYAYNHGVSPEKYLRFREAMPNFDSDGSGKYSKAEVQAALDSFGPSGDDNYLLFLIGEVKHGEGLSNAEKAVLWQSYNSSWKPWANPYDVSIGQKVYNIMKADAEKEKAEEEKKKVKEKSSTVGSFSVEMMRQLLENLK